MPQIKNYRVGWVIPDQLCALTHYSPTLMIEDFQAIAGETADLFNATTRPFHCIIDNRIMNMAFLPDLDTIKGSGTHMRHPNIRHIVMVKPQDMKGSAKELPSFTDDTITLTYVDSLEEAIQFFKVQVPHLDWSKADSNFFLDATVN